MADTILHRADSRGFADHGWLQSRHTFSFAGYYNPDRIHFGALRVLNDDLVAPGKGFGTHPHDNMEILSIPLEGDLEHRDSMGNVSVIRQGDVQVMSAGSGITHSEFNRNPDRPVKFLQIWVIPELRNVQPRYDQATLKERDRHNKLQQIVSPDRNADGLRINQQAWFHLGLFDAEFTADYTLRKSGNGVYAFVLKGEVTIAGTLLYERDGLGILNTDAFMIRTGSQEAEFLLIEVPVNF